MKSQEQYLPAQKDQSTAKFYRSGKFDPKQKIYNMFQIKQLIASSNCQVYDAQLLNETFQGKNEIALKVVPFFIAKEETKYNTEKKQKFVQSIYNNFFVEAFLLNQLKKSGAQHVVKIYRYYTSKDDALGLIAMEKLNWTLSYEMRLKKMKKNTFTELQLIQLFYQVSLGIKQLHKHKIMHRDFKPDNVVWDKSNKLWKLIDLGLSKQFYSSSQGDHTNVGTVLTMAPQFFNKTNKNETNGKIKYCDKIDVWSLGVVYYFIATLGTYPFESYNNKIEMQEFQKVLKRQFGDDKSKSKIKQSGCSPRIIEFIGEVLKIDRQDRMTIEELFNHEIFSNLSKDQSNFPYAQTKAEQEGEDLLEYTQFFNSQSQSIQNQLAPLSFFVSQTQKL